MSFGLSGSQQLNTMISLAMKLASEPLSENWSADSNPLMIRARKERERVGSAAWWTVNKAVVPES